MIAEYDTLMKNKTWLLVPRPEDRKVLTNRWVYKIEYHKDGTLNKYKATLVARGHTQQKGINYEEVFAPVARYEIIRTLLAVAVDCEMYGLCIRNIEKLKEAKCLPESKFEMTDLGPINEILGIKIERNDELDSMKLSQRRYIEELI
ncbi:uncharacterized protein LOC144473708 [Augochlora pura]